MERQRDLVVRCDWAFHSGFPNGDDVELTRQLFEIRTMEAETARQLGHTSLGPSSASFPRKASGQDMSPARHGAEKQALPLDRMQAPVAELRLRAFLNSATDPPASLRHVGGLAAADDCVEQKLRRLRAMRGETLGLREGAANGGRGGARGDGGAALASSPPVLRCASDGAPPGAADRGALAGRFGRSFSSSPPPSRRTSPPRRLAGSSPERLGPGASAQGDKPRRNLRNRPSPSRRVSPPHRDAGLGGGSGGGPGGLAEPAEPGPALRREDSPRGRRSCDAAGEVGAGGAGEVRMPEDRVERGPQGGRGKGLGRKDSSRRPTAARPGDAVPQTKVAAAAAAAGRGKGLGRKDSFQPYAGVDDPARPTKVVTASAAAEAASAAAATAAAVVAEAAAVRMAARSPTAPRAASGPGAAAAVGCAAGPRPAFKSSRSDQAPPPAGPGPRVVRFSVSEPARPAACAAAAPAAAAAAAGAGGGGGCLGRILRAVGRGLLCLPASSQQ
jgi:hypothetical protein